MNRRREDPEDSLLEIAPLALQRTTGLKAVVIPKHTVTPGHPTAVILRIETPEAGLALPAEVKAVDNKPALAMLKRRLDGPNGNGILITPYMTPFLADHCRELDLQFLDAAGNAYIRAPGIFVFVRGVPRPPMAGARRRLGGAPAALRIAFALLCNPGLERAPYRRIAEAAAVALGTVTKVMEELRARGFLVGMRTGERYLRDQDRLQEEWIANYPTRLRPKLHPRRFHARDPYWWREAHLLPGAFWGGEVAAHRTTRNLQPALATIYVQPKGRRECLAALAKEYRITADEDGNIEIVDAFWDFETAPPRDVVPPLLIRADLLATLDPRNLEAAAELHERS